MLRSVILFLLTALGLVSVLPVQAQTWTAVVPGIDYRYYRFESPQNDIFVTRMDRTTTSVIVDASLANGKITQPGVGYNAETVPAQVSRYDGAFGFWGRQTGRYRYKVIAAINGNGFSTTNGCPDSAMVMNGAFMKRTFYSSELGVLDYGSMGFLYKLGSSAPTPGTPYMGGDVYLPADQTKNRISFTDGTYLQFHKINDQPQTNRITLYTHHYGPTTPATAGVTEIVVKTANAQPLRILPWSNFTTGTAVEIRKSSSGGTVIPFDGIVIVASGSLIDDVEGKIPSVGTEVRFSCETNDTGGTDWTNMYAAIGPMWGVILRDGVKPSTTSPSYTTDVHPRTAVAYSSQYIYFIVVDGRSSRSTGITLSALADWCISEFSATDAVNNDGGGSSTMWVDGQIRNVPSDPGNTPRAVANGLMMIELQPRETSSAFTIGEPVRTVTPGTTLNLRTGPGTNFHAIQALADGSVVTVLNHSLKGIRAQDIGGGPGYWWSVRTATGVEGWLSEYYLISATGACDWNLFD